MAVPITEDRPDPDAPVGRLAGGKLRTFDIVFFVVGAAAPLTVVAGSAPLAFRLGGISAPAAYLFAGVVYIVLAVGFTAMSEHMANAGAFYAYISRGLAKPASVGAALVALLSYCAICTGFYGAFGFFARNTLADLTGVTVPWPLWALAAVAVVGCLGYRQIDVGARVLGVFMAAEVLILIVVAVAVLVTGGPEGMSARSFQPGQVFGAGAGGMFVLVLGAFIGFEGTAIYSEEAQEPKRTIPRATYLAVAFLAMFYTFATWAATVGFGADGVVSLAQSDDFGNMYFDLADKFVGHTAKSVMEVLIVTSIFAALIAFHNASTRYLFALGRERLLPRRLARTHTKHSSPHVASVVMTAVSVVVVVFAALVHADPYMQLLLWTNGVGIIGIVALQVLCALAVIRFFWKDDRGHHFARVKAAPALAAVGLTAGLYLMLTNFELLTGRTGWINGALLSPVVLLGLGGAGYALRLRARRPDLYALLASTDATQNTKEAS
ncbi:APC family permease [Streptomyces yanii]|uniref:APC family permease n=1 Tax=Streptomyces yanii TaxID=78510 RepID=A0ABV5RM42_9ACTN